MLFTPNKWVAVDYDRREFRLVVYQYARRVAEVVSVHSAAIPAGVDVTNPIVLGRCLGAVVSKLHLRGAKAAMCVGRLQAVLKGLHLPIEAGAPELTSMVRFQVSKELSFGADEAVMDFTVGAHWDSDAAAVPAGGTDILAAAVRVPVIEFARQLCQEAGLKLQRLGLRPWANLTSVSRCVRTGPGERVLLVALTAYEAEIDVIRDQSLEFSRSASTGASLPAELTSIEEGEADESDSSGAVGPRSGAVRRVLAEVTRSLQSFHGGDKLAKIDACLVSGATGMENELAAALRAKLEVPCEIFDPSGGFGIRPTVGVSAFSAALGLAGGKPGQPLPFDFLNPKRPTVVNDSRKYRLVTLAGAAAGFIVMLAVIGNLYAISRRPAISELQRQRAQLEKDNQELKKASARVMDVQRWQSEEVNWLDQLAHLANTLPDDSEVYLTGLRLNPPPSPGAPARIALKGQAKVRDSVLRFDDRMMSTPGYDVSRPNTSPNRGRFEYDLQFTMDLLVSPKAQPVVAASRPASGPATKPGKGRPATPAWDASLAPPPGATTLPAVPVQPASTSASGSSPATATTPLLSGTTSQPAISSPSQPVRP